jgi:hypothetical protein
LIAVLGILVTIDYLPDHGTPDPDPTPIVATYVLNGEGIEDPLGHFLDIFGAPSPFLGISDRPSNPSNAMS